MSVEGYSLQKRVGLVGGLVLFFVLLLLPTPEGMTPEGHRAGAVAFLMAVWWMTEALPLAATALLPIGLYPLLGVLSGKDVTLAYGDDNIFLFMGGFFIAMAMQKWNLHERIALNIVVRTGTNPSRLVLGFMLATAFLSMWISNTATTLMMLPIAMAVIDEMGKRSGKGDVAQFAVCLLLGVAYSASIGGVATLIGTPPNGVLLSQYGEMFPDAPDIGFVQWMIIGVPFSAIMLPLAWLLMTRLLFHFKDLHFEGAREEIQNRLTSLGKMSRGETIVLIVWIMTALSWIFLKDIEIGSLTIPGWANLFPDPTYIRNSTVAMFFAIVLFAIPVDLKKREFALDWEWAVKIPWGVLILFGGGLALAKAFGSTGLVEWTGDKLNMLEGVSPLLVIVCIALMLTFLTEMTSNVATTSIMLPILGMSVAGALGVNPLLLMIPAAMSASCAFMLPVATPPNAIVFGGGHITVAQMARAGILLNLIGVMLITLITYFLAVPVFEIVLGEVPEWAVLSTE
ncbi:MAG TPA: SLC13/DASS family transporter [Candidatus Hydrogenedentes bacterium]|nr:SLC13/DASS family transporter [Candidatus Hydrogenedentota bacterium]